MVDKAETLVEIHAIVECTSDTLILHIFLSFFPKEKEERKKRLNISYLATVQDDAI